MAADSCDIGVTCRLVCTPAALVRAGRSRSIATSDSAARRREHLFVSSVLTREEGRNVSRHHRSSVTDLCHICAIGRGAGRGEHGIDRLARPLRARRHQVGVGPQREPWCGPGSALCPTSLLAWTASTPTKSRASSPCRSSGRVPPTRTGCSPRRATRVGTPTNQCQRLDWSAIRGAVSGSKGSSRRRQAGAGGRRYRRSHSGMRRRIKAQRGARTSS
jgi:hypothetical protein